MTAVPPPLPPSPWGEMPPAPVQTKPIGEPYRPLAPEELAALLDLHPNLREFDPYRCMFDRLAEDPSKRAPNRYDGGLHLSRINGQYQCRTALADPTRSRYCRDHARRMGVDYYDPETETELSVVEGHQRLYANVGASISTMLEVMQDPDTPAGVRAKTAEAILDRTGFTRGLKIEAKVEVDDSALAQEIRDRLDRLATVTDISTRRETTE